MLWVTLIGLSSCGKGEDSGGVPQPGSERTDPQEVTEDPEGTVELSMSVDGNTLDGVIKIDKDRNFSYAATSYYYDLGMYFAATGRVYGLGNVNYIPTTGWASKVAIREGYGYVAYNRSSGKFYRMYVMMRVTILKVDITKQKRLHQEISILLNIRRRLREQMKQSQFRQQPCRLAQKAVHKR